MVLKEHASREKLAGSYYTPAALADAIVEKAFPKPPERVLEPSCGDGVFLSALASKGFLEAAEVTSVEIESAAVEQASRILPGQPPLCEDFFAFYERVRAQGAQYDCILGNPPYIRYQYLTPAQREMGARMLAEHGMRENGLINAWALFLLACTSLLQEGGTMAFVLPSDLLQVSYAQELRAFLGRELSAITLVAFRQLVFPDIQQAVVVLIGEKGGPARGVRMVEVEDVAEFARLDLVEVPFHAMVDLCGKWKACFVTPEEAYMFVRIQQDPRFAPMSDFGLINVGITTGHNRFFAINDRTCRDYSLQAATVPLLYKGAQVTGIRFTAEQWRAGLAAGQTARLLMLPDGPLDSYPEPWRAYIRAGEEQMAHLRYKCRIRDPWYRLNGAWAPDLFFTRATGGFPRLIRNEAGAVSLDCINRMKLHPGVDAADVQLGFYNSVSYAFAEACGRSYGGGMLELIPSEQSWVAIARTESVPGPVKADILCTIDRTLAQGGDIARLLRWVDETLLVRQLGVDPELCRLAHSAWNRLRDRRLRKPEAS